MPIGVLTGFAAVIGLAVHGFVTSFKQGIARSSMKGLLRGYAFLSGAGTLALFMWGILHVGSAVLDAEDGGAGSSPIRPCRHEGRPEIAMHVVDYRVDYLPIRFTCLREDGSGYAADAVPGYVNPGVLGLAVVTTALAAGAAFLPGGRKSVRKAGRRAQGPSFPSGEEDRQ